jgi:N6-L-threonylcarbamoyladenine synthase
MIVLGIESSCDETAAAVVKDGVEVLSSVIFSQIHLHSPYGGVVPEIASRSHVEVIPSVIEEAMIKAAIDWNELDAVAVTYGPGLASSLLVGISMAKALALRLNIPLWAINHLHGHIYSAFLAPDAIKFKDACPFLSLVVSGGHTCLVRVDSFEQMTLLGQTIDDAAGEAFDKGATLLGLGYPGGPVIDKTARDGDCTYTKFPQGRLSVKAPVGDLDPSLCFSFSGLKTAMRYYLEANPLSEDRHEVPSIAASYQEAIIGAIVSRCEKALGDMTLLATGGGVSLNGRLRERLQELADEKGITLMQTPPSYCGDNAAMIAALAGMKHGITGDAAMAVDAEPSLRIV